MTEAKPAQSGDRTGHAAPFDASIRGFLLEASSAAPTPGGGSVAALVAALGASMTSMVANLTQGSKFAAVEPVMVQVATDMQQSMKRFEELLQRDIESFNRYMAALKLPKASDDEKAHRRQALQEATIGATEVPIALAEACLHALKATYAVARDVNPHVLSDLGIAAMLLDTSGQAALLTADINIPTLKDEATRTQFLNTRNSLGQRLVEIRAETVGIVRERM